MDKKQQEKLVEQFNELPKTADTLAEFLKISIATIAYKNTKNTTQHCICTLSEGLVKTYCKVLDKELTDNITKLFKQKHNSSDEKLFVYNLIEGKRTLLPLKNKKWKIVNFTLLTKENEASIIEFIKTTFPSKTTKTQKKAFVGDKK